MASILKVDTIQDQSGNNIINESANTITIGASGDTITIPSGATLANSGIITGFESTGIDDNATSTAITIDSNERVGIGTSSPANNLDIATNNSNEGITIKTTGNTNNVITEAVMGTREVPDYQGIDQSKLVPLLVKTIQELEARITQLENA